VRVFVVVRLCAAYVRARVRVCAFPVLFNSLIFLFALFVFDVLCVLCVCVVVFSCVACVACRLYSSFVCARVVQAVSVFARVCVCVQSVVFVMLGGER